MAFYDKATEIVERAFPSQKVANAIVKSAFPAMAAADRIVGGVGLFPRGGRGAVQLGRRIAPPGARTMPGRSRLGDLVAKDSARRGVVVNIQSWAGLMQQNGIPEASIFGAYEAAGGSPVLSAAQAAGDTSDFLGDFVEALEAAGADPAVLLGTYQQAGGQIGR